ncbi:MAG: DNA polymerase III subunit beta [Candidatus Levybacteria bacterium]|nr:DNA polymerase III subunit beta [Candidatus Levybacteria bacterium]
MKASFLLQNLSRRISFVNHAVSAKSQLPILLNFLIEAKKGRLIISATDLEIGIVAEVPAKIEEEGSVTIPAKAITELISVAPIEKITLQTKPEGLFLTGERVKTTFQTMPTDEFPKLYGDKGSELIRLKRNTIDKEFSRVVFAASQDAERPALSGVLIKEGESMSKEGFSLVATDGYRLSLQREALGGTKKKKTTDASMIVPSRVIRELILMNKEASEGGDIGVYVPQETNQVIFSQNDVTIVGRLIEAEFPNFEKIIPQDYSTKTIFEKEALQRAVKASYVFARQTANIVKLSIMKDKIVVSANAPSFGSSVMEVDAKTTGEENEIAFSVRYLLDFFSNIDGEEVSFEMTGPLNPGVFKIVGDDTYLHLIMPIRIQQEA